jgi:hypothetical protein
MARGSKYLEGRLYMAGASIALLLVTWAALTVRDFGGGDGGASAAPVQGGSTLLPGSQPNVQPVPNPQPAPVVPHTRTRGS